MSRPTTKQGNLKFLRVAITLQTLVVFVQAISAGVMLSAPESEVLHSAGARVVFAAVLLHLLAAILVWRPGGGSPRSILYAAGFFVLTSAQIALGIAHVSSLHVPLGVLLFGMSVLQLARSWAGRVALESRPAGA
ncbi:hypothetical protein [Nonomuraea zeae]|uniref:Uncharacterized protein n=1 Tax=Nonomuraea zeae TaxID=1642303 RepID=A0A5S4G2T1_9ACTN|nr:hypothetical protein [Nonomuraea zeae]TMR27259.1 hypothetical protein ETD85_39695 [Nonomuraea zeae]